MNEHDQKIRGYLKNGTIPPGNASVHHLSFYARNEWKDRAANGIPFDAQALKPTAADREACLHRPDLASAEVIGRERNEQIRKWKEGFFVAANKDKLFAENTARVVNSIWCNALRFFEL